MALSDEEDEWDKKIKDRLRYDVRLLIKHPNIDPAVITNTLRLEPNLCGMVGTQRIAPTGKALSSIYRESAWSYWFRTGRNRSFFGDVVKIIDKLEPHRNFLHEIVDGGGTICISLHLPGDINIGDVFQWRDMVRLCSLRIDLDVEIFPDFN